MRAVVRWLMQHVVLLGLLTAAAAGCSAERDDSTADATTSSSIATAGPVPFVGEARAMTFGSKDFAAASDGELLRLGKVVCDGLGIEGLGSVGSSSDLYGQKHTRRPPKPGRSSGARCATFAQSMPAPSADVAAVHARYARDRQIGGQRAPAVMTGSKESQVSPAAQLRPGTTVEGGPGFESPCPCRHHRFWQWRLIALRV
jgi:hypothetical protein